MLSFATHLLLVLCLGDSLTANLDAWLEEPSHHVGHVESQQVSHLVKKTSSDDFLF